MIKRVKKVWGSEEWIVNNEKYCGKRLLITRGYCCSIHMHKLKDETFYIVRGKVLIEVSGKRWIMNVGDSVRIKPETYHSFTGLEDSDVMEFSTRHLESDSYRKTVSGKAHLFKAYDYDGVITSGIIPDEGSPIITGRSFEQLYDIEMKGHPIYFNPVTRNRKTFTNEVAWKALIINRLKIDEFYEDNPKMIIILTKKCPNCNIVKV